MSPTNKTIMTSEEQVNNMSLNFDKNVSLSVDGHDSCNTSSSSLDMNSSYYSSEEDDDDYSHDSSDDEHHHDDSEEEEDAQHQQQLFISSAMQNLLRRSVGSDSNLQALTLTQDPSIQSMMTTTTTTRRRGSDGGVNRPESRMVYVIQTKSATEQHTPSNEPAPYETLQTILKEHGASIETRPAQSLQDYWVPWNSHGYTVELTDAVRKNDLAVIRHLHEETEHNLQCCNKFGESIVHTAARRGSLEVLQYLIQIANLSLHVCCDNGRTPLQDACWTVQPNFDCVRFLLQQCADFLLLTDKRGLTPLEYAPKDTWEEWNVFLKENALLLPGVAVAK